MSTKFGGRSHRASDEDSDQSRTLADKIEVECSAAGAIVTSEKDNTKSAVETFRRRLRPNHHSCSEHRFSGM